MKTKKLNILLVGMFSAIILTACNYSDSNSKTEGDEYKQQGYAFEIESISPLEEFVLGYGQEMTTKFSRMLGNEQTLDIEIVNGYELVLTLVSHNENEVPDLGMIEQRLSQMASEIGQQLDAEEVTLTFRFIGSNDTVIQENSWTSC